jgi:two-component system cell cycle sensor histidine kinase/response regulator CckA
MKDSISFILDSALEVANIVQDLLTLSQKEIALENHLNLADAIDDYFSGQAYEQIMQTWPNLEFTVEIEKDLLEFRGSAPHIMKLIINLITNAVEAIKGRGSVSIEVFSQYVDTPLFSESFDIIPEGDYVVLRISDSEKALSQKDLSRIFEPFYTKKKMNRQSPGLALSVAWSILRAHNGFIKIENEKNSGTFLEFFFPAGQ